jgi:hypothetical protein
MAVPYQGDSRSAGLDHAPHDGMWSRWWLPPLDLLQPHFTFDCCDAADDASNGQHQRHYGSATGMFLGSNRGPSSLRTVKRQRHHTPSIKGSSMDVPRLR